MTVDPCEGLTDGQVVKVYGTEFTPGKTVAVNICAAVTIDFTVEKVLSSKDPVDCGTKQCVLSVGELVAGDAERADAVGIKFAA